MTAPAPIAVFLYNRPDHARGLLECLARDPLIADTSVTIYCDGAKNDEHRKPVGETRDVAREMAPEGARIVEREENLGLARSIISGVTEQCAAHGRVIVLEDDLRPSPAALTYFNSALDRYADEDRVMHISGYIYPVGVELPEMFFYREASCWGWATWARAWEKFEPDARKLLKSVRQSGRVREFDIDGTYDYERMLYLQWRGKVDSWAIRWYASVFLNGGLCLHPGQSLIANHGFDGSGVHYKSPAKSAKFDVEIAEKAPLQVPSEIREDPAAIAAMTAYRKAWRAGNGKRKFWKRPFKDIHYRLRLPV